MPEAEGFLDAVDVVEGLIDEGNALAVSTPGFGGLAEALFKMWSATASVSNSMRTSPQTPCST